jgi:starvation-inducible DNA-binding protein
MTTTHNSLTPRIDLETQSREAIGRMLNILLADEHVLYLKTRNFHWNVTGKHFNDLHAFFEGQYDEIEPLIDEIAERARMIGVTAAGSMTEFMKLARLSEVEGTIRPDSEMIQLLLDDHETLIRYLRSELQKAEELGDMGTSDFLTTLMQKHEKMAWMLRSLAT